MSTISNLSIVVQQGDAVREVNNDKLQPQHVNQVAEVNRQEEENRIQMTVVQESDDSSEISPDGERKGRFWMKRNAKKEKIFKSQRRQRKNRCSDRHAGLN